MKLIAPIILGLVCVVAMAFADYDSYGSYGGYGGNIGSYGGEYGYGSYGYVGNAQRGGSGLGMWLPILGLLLILPLFLARGPNTIQLVNQSG
ncbi:hypothetical protein DPMN_142974 [Dreissena polymorpha]|uniref:Uncharacterized protein n=1 Tax=Dreissena polymorpha TaxID=45954 RepID=A0A9D4JMQ1_DREPO|nr:hypothetical protein DPMN_193890 [Dreissena polymorpha]KAH3814473.1 hypothetical protein DPMN_142974 [Dreissena polymorpha]